MMKARADLHVHSRVSDGVHSPSELVRLASDIGLGGISLTDHDTLDGIHEFLNADGPEDLARISGVEVSCEYDGHEAHMLGYFIGEGSPDFRSTLRWLEDSRERRFPRMVEKLKNLGIRVTQSEVEEMLRGVMSPGRPHLARILVEKGIVNDVDEAFQKFLGNGKPAYVKKDLLGAKEAIDLIRKEGAVPVLAHPLTMKISNWKEVLVDLKQAGLEGVETYYDYSHLHMDGDISLLQDLAGELALIQTGGSDHHGDNCRRNLGDVTVPMSIVEELRQIAVTI